MAAKHIKIPRLTKQEITRFWSYIWKYSDDDCWEWIGAKIRGYGIISFTRPDRRGNFFSARISYFLHYRVDPGDMMVCHTCDNPPCCNPKHLFLGTTKDNAADMMRKGRGAIGDKNGSRKHPERLPRGEDHWSHNKPECLARGERHGSVTCPGRLPTGDNHWARRRPELLKTGEKHHGAKLTDNLVLEIRARYIFEQPHQREMAKEYGIRQSSLWAILHGKTWRHLPKLGF